VLNSLLLQQRLLLRCGRLLLEYLLLHRLLLALHLHLL
jgi:hypothetical protein